MSFPSEILRFSLNCLEVSTVVHGNKSESSLETRVGLFHVISRLCNGHVALDVILGSLLLLAFSS